MDCCKYKMESIDMHSCCSLQDTVKDAAERMRKSGCGCGCDPVVEDEQSRRLVGVVTERDVCHKVATVEEARRKLDTHQATSLPVVDEAGSCCGTISSHHLGTA